MKPITPILLLACSAFILPLTSCNGQTKSPAKTTSSTTTKPAGNTFKEGRDYIVMERVRVLDRTGFDQPAEAFSLLLPKGWTHQGEIIWRAPGSGCDGTNQRFRASSADGKFVLEILPAMLWNWSADPQMNQFNQNMPQTPFCSYGQPMNAEQYLRNVFVGELRQPEITKVAANPMVVQEMQQSNDKGRQELMRYGASDVQFNQTAVNANLRWSDGSEGIVLCGVSIIETTIPNVYNGTYTKSWTSSAAQRIVFRYPAGEGQQASHLLSVIMGSMHTNPNWKNAVNQFWTSVREQKQRVHIGKIKMMDEQTRAMGEAAVKNGQARLNSMDMDLRSWEQRQQSQDRIHTNFIKAIREVETYRDETGRIELSSGYQHAWSRSDGSSFIMTNNPNFDPSSVFLDQRWKEMRKVD